MIVALALVILLPQTTPSGGAIAKFVPPAPTPASFISDQRSVLTPEQRRFLDARISAIQSAGLGDIAVAILPSIGSYAPQQVAVEIYRTWKVGSVAAIDVATSGTRREDKLFKPEQLEHVYTLRRGLQQMPSSSAMEWLIKRIAATPGNDALLEGL